MAFTACSWVGTGQFPVLQEHRIVSAFVASLFSGAAIVLCNHPIDNVLTRMCNQEGGTGRAYSSTLQCFRQTLAVEGISGLYKGALVNWCRAGPHTTLCFVFLEVARQSADWGGL